LLSGGNCDEGESYISQFNKLLIEPDVGKVFATSDPALAFI
jgi:hypothetical protein